MTISISIGRMLSFEIEDATPEQVVRAISFIEEIHPDGEFDTEPPRYRPSLSVE